MSGVFAQSIRNEREQRGQSLAEFSEMLDVSKAALKRWERGLSTPSQAKIDQLYARLHQTSRPQTEPWMCHLGWWLRIGRVRHGLSIRKSAEIVGLPASTWLRYEDGQTPVSRARAIELVGLLGPPIQGFALSDDDPIEVLQRAMKVVESRPDLGAALSASTCLADVDPDSLKMAHAVLGRSLIVMNEHDLAGRASLAARRLPGNFGDGFLDSANVEAVSLWAGFRAKDPGLDADARMKVLGRKGPGWPSDMQNMSELMRVMLTHWKNPFADIQHEIDDFLQRHPGHSLVPIAELMGAWADVVQDRTHRARHIATQYTSSHETYTHFLSHKVLFECALRSGDMQWAREALHPLQAHKDAHGIWSPDLSEKARRVNAAFLH